MVTTPKTSLHITMFYVASAYKYNKMVATNKNCGYTFDYIKGLTIWAFDFYNLENCLA